MKIKEKQKLAYFALNDLYHEFNHAVNHLLIIREFMQDILNLKENKEMVYDFQSINEYKKH